MCVFHFKSVTQNSGIKVDLRKCLIELEVKASSL